MNESGLNVVVVKVQYLHIFWVRLVYQHSGERQN